MPYIYSDSVHSTVKSNDSIYNNLAVGSYISFFEKLLRDLYVSKTTNTVKSYVLGLNNFDET